MASIGELHVNMSTETFKKKLRAIAKHAAALADELDEIDKSECPACGKGLDKVILPGDGLIDTEFEKCKSCGFIKE